MAAPALWRIKGPRGAEITLFGSAPAATLNGPWRTAEFDEALANADEVWFESAGRPGPITLVRLFGIVSSRGGLSSGETLTPMLSADGQQRLKRLATRLSLDPRKLDGMQPWWADLSTALALQDRYKGKDRDGVERYVAAHAPKHARRRAFDTTLHDMEALAASPRDEQVADFEFALKKREQGVEPLEPRMDDWLSGDTTAMSREIIEPFRARAPKSFNAIVRDRHAIWAGELSRLLEGDRKVLVIVSVGNLVGPDSLPTLLRRRGLAIEGP